MTSAGSALLSLASGHSGPVSLVNLLKFKGEEGKTTYKIYMSKVSEILQRIGAEVVFEGSQLAPIIGDKPAADWDAIVIARYPSLAAFLGMVKSAEYQQALPYREKGLERSAVLVYDGKPIFPKL